MHASKWYGDCWKQMLLIFIIHIAQENIMSNQCQENPLISWKLCTAWQELSKGYIAQEYITSNPCRENPWISWELCTVWQESHKNNLLIVRRSYSLRFWRTVLGRKNSNSNSAQAVAKISLNTYITWKKRKYRISSNERRVTIIVQQCFQDRGIHVEKQLHQHC